MNFKRTILGAVVVVAGALIPLSAGANSPAPSGPLDPIATAMGAVDTATVDKLRFAQDLIGELPEAQTQPVYDRLDLAKAALYTEAGNSETGRQARKEWSDCMTKRGHDPAALVANAGEPDHEVDVDISPDWLACDDATSVTFDVALRAAYGRWRVEQAPVLRDYAVLLTRVDPLGPWAVLAAQ